MSKVSKSKENKLTHQAVLSLFDYDPSNVAQPLVYKKSNAWKTSVGDRAGWQSKKTGHWSLEINHESYRLHRVVYFYHKGHWPANSIDHEDQNPSNNLIENLLDKTHQQNMRNKGMHGKNTTGYPGVTKRIEKNGVKYHARSSINGKREHVYYGDNKIDAYLAYVKAGWKNGYSDKHLIPTRKHELIVARNLLNR